MARHKKHNADSDVQTDLPITPMLDMSFQLLAFFVFTFKPTPSEGQITLYLPKLDGNPDTQQIIPDDKPIEPKKEYTVIVRAAEGTIASIDFRDEGAPEPLGTSPARLLERLKQIPKPTDGPAPNVKIEADDNLGYASLVQLMDVCIKAGFASVGVAPISAASNAAK